MRMDLQQKIVDLQEVTLCGPLFESVCVCVCAIIQYGVWCNMVQYQLLGVILKLQLCLTIFQSYLQY